MAKEKSVLFLSSFLELMRLLSLRLPNRLGLKHGLQSRPPSPKRAERKVRRRPFREAGSGQNNGTR